MHNPRAALGRIPTEKDIPELQRLENITLTLFFAAIPVEMCMLQQPCGLLVGLWLERVFY